MEPCIPYAQTTDGVSIAYWTVGTGTPLVVMPTFPFSHVELEWQMREYRRYYERPIENINVIRYDNRGSVLSDCGVANHSPDAHVHDLEAVVDRLGLHRIALVVPLNMGPTEIAFSVHNSERVSHLVPWCSFARMSDYRASQVTQALVAMRDKDFVLYTETVSHAAPGWAEGEPVSAAWLACWRCSTAAPLASPL